MEELNTQNNQTAEPGFFKVLRVLGFCCIPIAIAGAILAIVGFTRFGPIFMLGGFLLGFGIFFTITFLIIGFIPKIQKAGVKYTKHFQQDNRADLTEISNTQADIRSEAIKKTARAVKQGLTDVKYCQECGAEIDKEANFCSKCGAKQN